MAWLDELKRLRVRVDNEGYGKRMAEVAERRALLERYADRLGVLTLLTQMNDTLLDGGGSLITDRSWQYDFEGDEDTEFDNANDEIRFALYWHDGEQVDLEVRVGIDEDDAGYVMVSFEEIDDDEESLQAALLAAFRDIAEMD